MTADRRAAYVADACGDDAELRDEVLQLLAEFERPAKELELGAAAAFPSLAQASGDSVVELPEILADRYRIERVLGEGGMAVVYLAHDLRLARSVAIKVLRPDAMRHAGSQRFDAEIRLTAQLRHPNIVPLFDSGTAGNITFFVMPYLEGETLHALLDRVASLPPRAATRIVLDVAAALEYAHRVGVVHRDVKPSNILLTDGHTMLADFGIARTSGDAVPQFTRPGEAVGTPAYMSPEQCDGSSTVGVASDIYSLGAVLFRLLSGERPHPAFVRLAMLEAGVATSLTRRPERERIPAPLRSVIDRATAMRPEDRYGSAADFAAALQRATDETSPSVAPELAPTPSTLPNGRSRKRLTLGVALRVAVLVVLAVAIKLMLGDRTSNPPVAAVATGDTSRYLLLPYEYAVSPTLRFGRPDPMRAVFDRWSDVTLVDEVQGDEALGVGRVSTADSTVHLSTASAVQVARAVGAGRFVRREVSMRGAQAFLHGVVYDAGSGRPIGEGTVNLGVDLEQPEAPLQELADQLLLPTVPLALRSGVHVGTRSRPGLQSFASGLGAVDRWDLPFADSALERAAAYDSAFARARLWLAQVRLWRHRPRETWNFLVNRAATARASLAPRDQLALDALVAQGNGDDVRACARWARLAVEEATDFSAWYGAAMCQLQDDAVVRDPRSSSGWSFRSSDQRAITMLRRAFEIFPVVHREFRTSWFAELDGLLLTTPTQLRIGFAQPPDTGMFMAYPSWSARGDSLAFVPYRARAVELGAPETLDATHHEAVRRQREIFLRTATTWRAAFPHSADALLAVAIALDKRGDRSALDSLQLARTLAVDDDERLRAGAATVWMLVKYGLPDDLAALGAARALADSLLAARGAAPSVSVSALASVAMLSGKVALAIELARASSSPSADPTIPGTVQQGAVALQLSAAAGASGDSLRLLELEVERGIARSVSTAMQDGARQRLLGRAATLAFPGYRSPLIATLADAGEPLAQAQQAVARSDTVAARRALARLVESRHPLLPEEVKLETLLPEALLLMSLGDAAGGVARLQATLDAQRFAELEIVRDPIGAGVLVRALAARAELAAAVGDPSSARRWGRAFLTLWGDGDAIVRPQVARVSQLTGIVVK